MMGACKTKTDSIKVIPINSGSFPHGRGGDNEIKQDTIRNQTPINTPRRPR